jgi:Leucine-rich repeat (LRR) protein
VGACEEHASSAVDEEMQSTRAVMDETNPNAPPQTNPGAPRGLSWRFRFSLRLFLIFITLFCVALGYILNEALRQKEIIAELNRLKASIVYEGEKPSWLPDAFDTGQVDRIKKAEVFCKSAKNLAIIGELWSLQDLVLKCSKDGISDLSPLANLKHLERLVIGHEMAPEIAALPKVDIASLAHLANLKKLYLWNLNVHALTPLNSLRQLEELDIKNSPVSEISALAKLTNLRDLVLVYTNVSDISAIGGLTNLRRFAYKAEADDLPSNNPSRARVSDISSLANLTKLESLTLERARCNDLAPIRNLAKLKLLNVDGTPISDLSKIATCKNLTDLGIEGTQVKDLSSLSELKQLEILDMRGVPAKDVSVLLGLAKLQSLSIDGTPEAMPIIARLKSLDSLELGVTQVKVSDLDALKNLPKLEFLTLLYPESEPVSDNELSALEKLLPACSIAKFDRDAY